jgi:Zn finger protein HypA/HybF involved in hydrogenase expression
MATKQLSKTLLEPISESEGISFDALTQKAKAVPRCAKCKGILELDLFSNLQCPKCIKEGTHDNR